MVLALFTRGWLQINGTTISLKSSLRLKSGNIHGSEFQGGWVVSEPPFRCQGTQSTAVNYGIGVVSRICVIELVITGGVRPPSWSRVGDVEGGQLRVLMV